MPDLVSCRLCCIRGSVLGRFWQNQGQGERKICKLHIRKQSARQSFLDLFFVLRSSSYLERHQHSELMFPACGVAGVEGGGQLQFAGALAPAQIRDPHKPPSAVQWLQVSDSRGWRRTESPNAELCGTGTVNFSYLGPNSVSPDKVCMFLILLLPEGIWRISKFYSLLRNLFAFSLVCKLAREWTSDTQCLRLWHRPLISHLKRTQRLKRSNTSLRTH